MFTLVASALAWPGTGSAAAANTITVAPSAPEVSNCFPFGGFLADGGWGPNFAFVYKNMPAFHLRSGDVVAFDLGFPNDTDNRLDVAMAPTTGNGNDVNAGPFTTLASNSQTPTNPRGDSAVGNYELGWTVSSSFDFPGGGLLIRFYNPAGPFASDATCDAKNVQAHDSSDASGFFVGRRIGDADGVAPWDGGDNCCIAQFRLTLNELSNAFKVGKVKRNKRKGTAQVPVTVPGTGALTLHGKGLKAREAAGAVARTSVASAGTVKLAIKPKGKTRAKLLASGRAKVRVKITFTPEQLSDHPAATPRTKKLKVKLIRRV